MGRKEECYQGAGWGDWKSTQGGTNEGDTGGPSRRGQCGQMFHGVGGDEEVDQDFRLTAIEGH